VITHSAQQALEDRASVDDSTGADRSAGVVLGAAVFAMGLLAGSTSSRRSPSCRP
jgi:hypothetical protein